MHAIRLSVLIALLVGLHQLAGRHRSHSSLSAPDLVTIQRLLPKAAAVTETQAQPTLWEVTDQSGQALALVGLTSPMADNIVGYAGPNNVLLLLDNTGSVTSAELLGSSDTLDHVERVRQSSSFWQQFQGRQIGDNSAPHVDGVSGATLTSLAIAEAINLRLSGKRLNLRFPEEPTLDEAQMIYPLATSLQPDPSRTGLYRVSDLSQATIGFLLRTGPLVDDTIGYQGPTELLVAFDSENRITKIRMRRSYDNEPYVRYTRMEASFWSKFVGRTWEELSRIDLDAEGIEGVSGATMTSMAVAESLRLAAQRHLKESASDSSNAAGESSGKFLNILSVRRWNWSIGEIATAAIALLVMPWSMSRMRGQRHLRTLWQVIVLVVIVGLSGNLISLALLAGWTSTWPAWTLAPGLTLLVIIALGAPALTGRNVYCDHVCPHGTAQQWLVVLQRRFKTSSTTPGPHESTGHLSVARSSKGRLLKGLWQKVGHRLLHGSALVIIGLSITWIVWRVPSQLTFFEPFDVYAWRVGWSVSLGVWIASMLLASREPMGYCRLACPTGKVLESVRRKRAGRRPLLSDMLMATAMVLVWAMVLT